MILEPIIEVTVTTPDDYVGDVMSDINQRRGKVLGMEPTAGRTTVKALVPEAELYKYSTSLRAITQGRAHHSPELLEVRGRSGAGGAEGDCGVERGSGGSLIVRKLRPDVRGPAPELEGGSEEEV